MRIAFATEDKKTLYQDHFGDADMYIIYDVSKSEIKYYDSIKNTVKNTSNEHENENHGKKAKQILNLFRSHHVDALANKAFGRNIKKIRKEILPVISRMSLIEDVTQIIQNHLDDFEMVLKDKDEKYIIINQKQEIKVVNKEGHYEF